MSRRLCITPSIQPCCIDSGDYLQHPSLGHPTLLLAYTSTTFKYNHHRWARWIYLVGIRITSKVRSSANSPFSSTSPSAYVVFEGISATGPCGIIDPTYASYTTSYAESDILTFRLNQPGLPHTIDYADFFSNCTTRAANYTYPRPSCEIELGDEIVNEYPSCVSQINLLSQSMNYDQIHCYPYFSYPSGSQAVNPAWATCVDSSGGGYFAEIFDPPRALTSVHDLVPAPTKDTGNAIPAASPSQPLPSRTTSPLSVSPPASGSKDDPSDQDPTDSDSSRGLPVADPHTNPGPVDGDTKLPDNQKTAASPISASASGGSGDPVNSPAPPVDNSQDSDSGQSKSQINEDVDPGNGANPIDPANDPANPPTQLFRIFTTIQGHTIQATSPFDAITIDGKPVARNQDSTLVPGTPVALRPNGDFVLGTSTISHLFPAQPLTPTSIFTIESQTVTLSSNKLLGAATTLNANDPGFTIDGTVVSLGSSGLQIGSSVVTPVTSAAVITAAGQPFTILSNGVAIAGTILTSNAQAITVGGTRISPGTQGLVVGTSTLPLPAPTPAQVIAVAGQAATLLSNGIIIAGTTLTPNAPGITISGTPISVGPLGVVVGTLTIPLTSANPTITVAGQRATVLPHGVIIAGTTLKANGPAITIAGTIVSLGPSGLVVRTSTVPLGGGVSPTQDGVGGFILAGLNGGPATLSKAGSNGTSFNGTGAAGGALIFGGGWNRAVGRQGAVAAMMVVLLSSWFQGWLARYRA